MNWFPILLLLLGGILLTFGDIAMKKWVINSETAWYVVGLAVYFIGLNFLAQSFKYKNIAVASTIFVLFNVITLTAVSWFYFKEKLTLFQLIGILMGMASIVFLEME